MLLLTAVGFSFLIWQVTRLFEGNAQLGSAEGLPNGPMARFERFMRRDMREHMANRVGNVTRLP